MFELLIRNEWTVALPGLSSSISRIRRGTDFPSDRDSMLMTEGQGRCYTPYRQGNNAYAI